MMRSIIASSMRARLLVVALGAAMMGIGVGQLRSMPVDLLPEFSPPTVEVQVEALGLSAAEVEQLITVPIEQDLLAGVPWLETIRSRSITGLSWIQMIFEWSTNPLHARQLVQERISQAAGLPNVSSPPQMLPPISSTGRVMMVRLSSDRLTPIQMSVLARWTIRPRLLGASGVANVSIWGLRDRQLQVQVDPARLRDRGVSLQQVIETTGNALWASPLTFLEASTPGTGGFIDTRNQRLGVQHLQPIVTAADLAGVPIEDGTGQALRLADVADVVEDHQPLIGDAVFADGPGLLLVIEEFPNANTVDVTHEVEEALDAMQPGLPGMEIDTSIYRPASTIQRSMGHLGTALLIGFLLLALALVLLLMEWRTALIVVVTVLASLSAAVSVLSLRGATMNAIVLAGLVMAIGAVVDDAVGDVASVARRLRQQRMNGRTQPPSRVVLDAALEMRSAAVYSTLIILVGLVPVLLLRGESGALFPPLVQSYALAVVASLVVTLVLAPALCLVLLAGAPLERREPLIARWLQGRYERALGGAMRAPFATVGAGVVIVVAGLAVMPFLQRATVPSFTDGNVLVQLKAAAGTSLPEMDRITARVGTELRSLTGVQDVGAHVGRALLSDQATGVDSGQLWIRLDPSAHYDATLASIREVVEGYPGIGHQVVTYPLQRLGDVLSSEDPPIVVRVYGPNLGVLRSHAEAVRQAISGIDGLVDPTVRLPVLEPTVGVEVDLAAAKLHGIKPGDVRRAASTLVSGTGVGSLYEEQKVFDVVVWGTPESRSSVTGIRDLLIDTPDGGHVRLGDVANVQVGSYPSVIRHEDISRYVDVRAEVSGRDAGAVAADVEQRLQGISFPLEHHAELVGNFTERQAAHGRFLAVVVAVAIGIFLLLQAAVGSWRMAFVLAPVVPVAMAGAVLAAFAAGRVVSMGSIAGFLAVFGIAVRTSVAQVRHYQRLGVEEGGTVGPDLVLRGSREHLVPILLTTAATALALLPFAVTGSAAGQEIVHPMSVVVLGGLVTSALAHLFVVPALYLRFGTVPSSEAPAEHGLVPLPEVEPVPGG